MSPGTVLTKHPALITVGAYSFATYLFQVSDGCGLLAGCRTGYPRFPRNMQAPSDSRLHAKQAPRALTHTH